FAVNAGNLEITDAAGTLSVPVSSLGSDDQNISGSGLSGTDLTIGIENGTNEVIDLSSLVDDADADPNNEIQDMSLAGNTLSLTGDATTVDLSGYLDNTDDQNLTLAGNTLSIEDGNSVDLSGFVSTDDQNLTGASLTGNTLQIDIEDGSSASVDLSSLVDDADADPTNELQTISRTGTDVTLSDGGGTVSVADNDNDSSNETNTAFAVNAGNLEITDAAGTLSVPVSSLGSDDQNLTLAGNTLSIEDGNSVDLSGFVSTDDQNISGSGLSGTDLTIGIENGTNEVVDLSSLLDNTDDQYDDEVPLRTPIDVDEGGESSPTNETTVQEVINAIAPITSKAARIFYPPSIAIDASANGTGFTEDLYAQYVAQFGTPAVASAGAPAALPTYAANELYYYVTYADPTVFDNMSIDANGVLTYDIIGQPADYNALINVVFVVK
ncbi:MULTISPECIES: hypothetical protein, partial [unclassified Robiginitalea]